MNEPITGTLVIKQIEEIKLSELIEQAKELNCKLSLNFTSGENICPDDANGVFVANFIPVDEDIHPIKSTWGYWSEVFWLNGDNVSVRLFKDEEPTCTFLDPSIIPYAKLSPEDEKALNEIITELEEEMINDYSIQEKNNAIYAYEKAKEELENETTPYTR